MLELQRPSEDPYQDLWFYNDKTVVQEMNVTDCGHYLKTE